MTAVRTVIHVEEDSVNDLFTKEGAIISDSKGQAISVDLERYEIDAFWSNDMYDGFSAPDGPHDRVRLKKKKCSCCE